MTPPKIFDRTVRRLRRDRVARGPGSPLEHAVAAEIVDRLSAVTRSFATALVINSGSGHLAALLRQRGIAVDETDHGIAFASTTAAICCDEDRLDIGDRGYDLVIMPCGLDTVDDVPGALIAARRALVPGGLFMGCLIGAPSLSGLRDVLRAADAAQDLGVARIHPQIDVRSAGDLLVRAGFALPVADAEKLELSYASFDRIIGDIRSAGLNNALAERRAVSRAWLGAARAAFLSAADGNARFAEVVTLLFLTGWAS